MDRPTTPTRPRPRSGPSITPGQREKKLKNKKMCQPKKGHTLSASFLNFLNKNNKISLKKQVWGGGEKLETKNQQILL
jgi:hypothetical protein